MGVLKRIILILCTVSMLIFSLLSSLFLLPALAFAGTCWNGGSSGTAPWYVKDGDGGSDSILQPDVNYCINTVATEGDTVYVPVGSSTWSSRINITKGIHIIGAGIDKTTITNGIAASKTGDYIFYYMPDSPATDGMVEITGFTFDGGNSGGAISIVNLSSTAIHNFRIHHNKIQNSNYNDSGEKQAGVYTRGNTFGLIDNNIFYNNLKDAVFLGNGTDSWITFPATSNIGTNNYLYFEDNTTSTLTTNRSFAIGETGEGARWVARHNTIDATNCNNTTGISDIHGDTLNRGVVAFEFYDNTVNNGYQMIGIDYRGGTGIIYNNHINMTGGSYEGRIMVREEYSSCTDAEGCAGDNIGCGDEVNNGYIWNNLNDYASTIINIVKSDTYGCLAEKDNWWDDYNNSPEYFTKDVHANRNLTRCIAEDVYWETDTKKLYRCTATNTWTLVYKPYIYPHPLQGISNKGATVINTIGGLNAIDIVGGLNVINQ